MYSSHHHDHYGSKLVKSPKDYLEVSKKRKRASKNVRQVRFHWLSVRFFLSITFFFVNQNFNYRY